MKANSHFKRQALSKFLMERFLLVPNFLSKDVDRMAQALVWQRCTSINLPCSKVFSRQGRSRGRGGSSGGWRRSSQRSVGNANSRCFLFATRFNLAKTLFDRPEASEAAGKEKRKKKERKEGEKEEEVRKRVRKVKRHI